jgi:DNA-directed RNA polymerase specialized sigma24 family protein
MKPARRDGAWRLYERALELPEAEREAFVEREAGRDVELRDEVLAMLRARVEPDRAGAIGELSALNGLLERLTTFDPEMARAIQLAFFDGLSLEETSRTLGLPLRTLERRWYATRTWMRAMLR